MSALTRWSDHLLAWFLMIFGGWRFFDHAPAWASGLLMLVLGTGLMVATKVGDVDNQPT